MHRVGGVSHFAVFQLRLRGCAATKSAEIGSSAAISTISWPRLFGETSGVWKGNEYVVPELWVTCTHESNLNS